MGVKDSLSQEVKRLAAAHLRGDIDTWEILDKMTQLGTAVGSIVKLSAGDAKATLAGVCDCYTCSHLDEQKKLDEERQRKEAEAEKAYLAKQAAFGNICGSWVFQDDSNILCQKAKGHGGFCSDAPDGGKITETTKEMLNRVTQERYYDRWK